MGPQTTVTRFVDFFKIMKTARITGINVNLLKRYAVILQTLSSRFAINSTAFRRYSMESEQLYLEEYSWYYMLVVVYTDMSKAFDKMNHHILLLKMSLFGLSDSLINLFVSYLL